MLHKSTYTAGDALAINGSLPPETPRKKRVLRGYKAQAALLQEAIERVVCSHEAKQVSLIMEGVHLDVRFIMALLSRHPAVVPFLIYISNEQKHRERFAVRSQHMTSAATLTAGPVAAAPLATAALTAAAVSPTASTSTLSTTTLPTATVAATALTASTVELRHNRYLAHFEAIRMIQRYLVKHADSCLLPKVDNTNVDRSVATIHSTLLRCLARTGGGASLFDPVRHQVVVMNQVFSSHRREVAWSSKAMLQVIQAKVEKRELFDRLFGAGAEAAGCAASAATSPYLAATSPHLAAATSPCFSCSPPPRSSSPARSQSRRDLGAAFPPGACGGCRLPTSVAATQQLPGAISISARSRRGLPARRVWRLLPTDERSRHARRARRTRHARSASCRPCGRGHSLLPCRQLQWCRQLPCGDRST